jgi:hypothetical protein
MHKFDFDSLFLCTLLWLSMGCGAKQPDVAAPVVPLNADAIRLIVDEPTKDSIVTESAGLICKGHLSPVDSRIKPIGDMIVEINTPIRGKLASLRSDSVVIKKIEDGGSSFVYSPKDRLKPGKYAVRAVMQVTTSTGGDEIHAVWSPMVPFEVKP